MFITGLVVDENTLCAGVARVGSDTQQIRAGTLTQMANADLGGPLHSLVIAGTLHPLETDMLKLFAEDASIFPKEK